MTYKEIISDNCQSKASVDWWPLFAFHYTDVTNAIGILREGAIFSRVDALNRQLMNNDNASRQVIEMTFSAATSNVRFYYRPLTPTQFHNEGYKHYKLRYCGDDNANVPVPVFFLFDLETVLQMEKTKFSEQSLAGIGSVLYQGENDFSKLNFSQIYKNGYMEDVDSEKKFRQAEIVYEGTFCIDNSLRWIVCRNDIERATLLNLLRKKAPRAYIKYQNLIIVRSECFEHNGLFITQCNYYEDNVTLVFSQTAKKRQYISRYKENHEEKLLLNAEAEFKWMKSSNMVLKMGCEFQIDYENSEYLTFTKLKKPDDATALYMKVTIENKLVCYMCWQLASSALI